METPDMKSLLMEKARNYCSLTGKSINTAGLESVNDGKFFDRLKKGGGFTDTTFKKAMQWFDDNTPTEGSPSAPVQFSHNRPRQTGRFHKRHKE